MFSWNCPRSGSLRDKRKASRPFRGLGNDHCPERPGPHLIPALATASGNGKKCHQTEGRYDAGKNQRVSPFLRGAE